MRQDKQPRPQMNLSGANPDDFLKRGARGPGAPEPRAMIFLRRSADREDGLDLQIPTEKFVMPVRPAFSARRQIGSLAVSAGVAEAHGHDRDPRRIIELFAGDAHPTAQPVARRVVERNPGRVNTSSWSLASDQQTSAGRNLQHGPRLMRQRPAEWLFDANAAGPDSRDQTIEVLDRGQGQAEALGRMETSPRQRAKCARSSGKTIRANRAKSAATIAVISAMENESPAR
jgi:hypothetical protein